MQFIGIDLAWSDDNPSGLAILEPAANGLQLRSMPDWITGVDDLCTKLPLTEPSVIAIDAPLIIANQTGQRPCEHTISRIFGRFKAGAHSTNLARYPQAPSVKLGVLLGQAGYQHLPVATHSASYVMLEVYPHPALVVLFNLETRIPYKKSPIAAKRVGLNQLKDYLQRLTKAELPLVVTSALTNLLKCNVDHLAGQAMKKYEDQLDALICAYTAAFAWYWQRTRVVVIGDLNSGYIVVPNHTAAGTSWPDA